MSYCSSQFGLNRHYRSSGSCTPQKTVRRQPSSRGFTLIELLVTLAVAAILLSVAAPSFRTFIQNAKLNSAADSFLAAIQQGRSEAITRGDPVLLCRTGDASSLTCRANEPDGSANQTNDWSPGWIMYVKEGYTGSGGTSGDYSNTDDGPPLKLGQPVPDGITITSESDGNQWLAFFADGTLNESGTVQYAVCDDRGAQEDISKMIVIQSIGRPYLRNFDATDTCSP